MLMEAAKAGLGVALVPDVFVALELDRGALVRMNPASLTSSRGYYAVYDPVREADPTLRAIRAWLLREAGRAYS